jgi:hypothetical protein
MYTNDHSRQVGGCERWTSRVLEGGGEEEVEKWSYDDLQGRFF